MTVFRSFLIVGWVILVGYTSVVIARHGMGFVSVFSGDLAAMAWPGQFNLDFTLMLALSALWVAWRHEFSLFGFLLALLALFGGSGFLYPYLLLASLQASGDARAFFLGASRASR